MEKLAAFKYTPMARNRRSFPASLGTEKASAQAVTVQPTRTASATQVKVATSVTSPSEASQSNVVKVWHWNVNGLKLVLKRNTLQTFLKAYSPTVLCLNETKLSEGDIADVRKKLSSYFTHMHFSCATNRRNYGGVAILYNNGPHLQPTSSSNEEEQKQEEVEAEASEEEDPTVIVGVSKDEQEKDLDVEGRVIAKVFHTFVLVSVYTPHSGVGDLKRLDYRVERWDRAFEAYVNRLKVETGKPVVVCGDLNIIRHDFDIYNPKTKTGRPGMTERERDSFERILENCSLHDTFRKKYPLRLLVYSHWTDRCGIARKNNWGSRMDYFLTSQELLSRVVDIKYQTQIEGSDHCPVTLELNTASHVDQVMQTQIPDDLSSDSEVENESLGHSAKPSKRAKFH